MPGQRYYFKASGLLWALHALAKLLAEWLNVSSLMQAGRVDSPTYRRRDGADRMFLERRFEAMAKRGPRPGTPQAKRGGQTVKEKYGPEFYKKIGKKGGDTVKKKYGVGFFEEIGKKGGETTKARHGVKFFEKIGKKGGRR